MSQLLPESRTQETGERWEPRTEMDPLRRLLDQAFRDAGWPTREAAALTPAVNIEEQDDAYVIEAELPGVRREDVDIEIVGNELTISGEFKERERAGVLRRRTRRVGRFEFRVALPEGVDPDAVDAELDHGVLTVRVPKAQRAARRQIEVKS
jgi:HSP20 family protein